MKDFAYLFGFLSGTIAVLVWQGFFRAAVMIYQDLGTEPVKRTDLERDSSPVLTDRQLTP